MEMYDPIFDEYGNKIATYYGLPYLNIICHSVHWGENGNIFTFIVDGNSFDFLQTEPVSATADTDHIKAVIEEQFLPWYKEWKQVKEKIKENE